MSHLWEDEYSTGSNRPDYATNKDCSAWLLGDGLLFHAIPLGICRTTLWELMVHVVRKTIALAHHRNDYHPNCAGIPGI
jgi:hypothetical protein